MPRGNWKQWLRKFFFFWGGGDIGASVKTVIWIIINWKKWSGKILGVNKVPYGLVKNCQVDSWHWWQILQDTLHSKKIVWHQLVEGSMWCHCWIVLYLMSRFFLITAQTREFPTILVMISTDVTTVTAISADSDITMSVLVTITEIM